MVAPASLPIREGASGFVAQFQAAHPPRYPKHWHEELELNLVTRGEASYLVGEQRLRLRRHSLLLLPPGREHVLLDCSRDFRMWVVALSAAGDRFTLDAASHRQRVLTPSAARSLADICEQITESPPLELLNAGLRYLLELVGKFLDSESGSAPTWAVHPAIAAAARRLQQDPTLELEELAKACLMSAGRLGRLFKLHMGVALGTYRNRVRLERTRSLLLEGKVNALEAAILGGFGSYAQFYRVFRQETGLTPRQAQREFKTPRE